MKMLVTGSSGFIGKNLVSQLGNKHEMIGISSTPAPTTHIVADLLADNLNHILNEVNPDAIVHCAALPNVDYCEEHPEEAYEKNVHATGKLVDWASRKDKTMIFFSTDYVYPGVSGNYDEGSNVSPLNVYGKNKLEAENLVRGLDKHIILRTTGVVGYDLGGKNFLMQMITNDKPRNVPSDQISNPTEVSWLIDVIDKMLDRKIYGTYIATGSEAMARSDFAYMICDVFDKDASLLRAVRTSELGQKAPRPLNNGLNPARLCGLLGEEMPPIRNCLRKIYEENI
jgi:dTDP-4-dehydrorhamnose reductase